MQYWTSVFPVSVSLAPQKMQRNCRSKCGQQLVAHPFSQFRVGFPQSVDLPSKMFAISPIPWNVSEHPENSSFG